MQTDFDKIAQQQKKAGVLFETYEMLRDNKKWWLVPVFLVLLVVGLLVFLSSTAAAPFIYTLF